MKNQLFEPESFATLSTKQTFRELELFLTSLNQFHKGAMVYICVDNFTNEYLKEKNRYPNIKIESLDVLEPYANLNRDEMEKLGIVTNFWNYKTIIMDKALESHGDVMYCDCDVVLLTKILVPRNSFVLGLSPQFIPFSDAAKVGYYNGGFVWTSDKSIPALWRRANQTSRYVDQASLETLSLMFQDNFFEFDEGHNIQPWRFILWGTYNLNWFDNIIVTKDDVFVGHKRIKSLHTHFNDIRFDTFNSFALKVIDKKHLHNFSATIGKIRN